jgi:hypothetical protein
VFRVRDAKMKVYNEIMKVQSMCVLCICHSGDDNRSRQSLHFHHVRAPLFITIKGQSGHKQLNVCILCTIKVSLIKNIVNIVDKQK